MSGPSLAAAAAAQQAIAKIETKSLGSQARIKYSSRRPTANRECLQGSVYCPAEVEKMLARLVAGPKTIACIACQRAAGKLLCDW
jgi:hypothetical protein